MTFIANCTWRGSPAPMPGALLALRVLVMTPKLVESQMAAVPNTGAGPMRQDVSMKTSGLLLNGMEQWPLAGSIHPYKRRGSQH